LVNDANANASQQTLQSDASAFASTSPVLQIGALPTPLGVLRNDVSNFTHQLGQAADALQTVADHPHLSAFHAVVAANPALAAQVGSILKFAAAASSQTQSAAPAQEATDSAPTSIPVPNGATVTVQHP
jgi:hypothetical protein